jgi:predicted ester cyclase
MSGIRESARLFFEACDEGKGWEVCQEYCHPDATFAVQADALADVTTVEGYADWLKGLYTFVTDERYELRCFAVDEERNTAIWFGVFYGTHTGEGGPVPPTGKTAETDYVYVVHFEGDRIRHMTKVWNDGIALRQLGWA